MQFFFPHTTISYDNDGSSTHGSRRQTAYNHMSIIIACIRNAHACVRASNRCISLIVDALSRSIRQNGGESGGREEQTSFI